MRLCEVFALQTICTCVPSWEGVLLQFEGGSILGHFQFYSPWESWGDSVRWVIGSQNPWQKLCLHWKIICVCVCFFFCFPSFSFCAAVLQKLLEAIYKSVRSWIKIGRGKRRSRTRDVHGQGWGSDVLSGVLSGALCLRGGFRQVGSLQKVPIVHQDLAWGPQSLRIWLKNQALEADVPRIWSPDPSGTPLRGVMGSVLAMKCECVLEKELCSLTAFTCHRNCESPLLVGQQPAWHQQRDLGCWLLTRIVWEIQLPCAWTWGPLGSWGWSSLPGEKASGLPVSDNPEGDPG